MASVNHGLSLNQQTIDGYNTKRILTDPKNNMTQKELDILGQTAINNAVYGINHGNHNIDPIATFDTFSSAFGNVVADFNELKKDENATAKMYGLLLITAGITAFTYLSGCISQSSDGSEDQDQIDAGIAYAQTHGIDLTSSFDVIQNYLEQTNNPLKGTDINVLGSKIRDIATLQDETPLGNGMTLFEYKWGKTRFEITGNDERTPYEIIVKYNNGKEIKAIDNHGNADLDIVIGTDKNGNEVFTYPSTADAQSQQDLLSGAPGSDIEKAVANYVADGSTIPLDGSIDTSKLPNTPEAIAVKLLTAVDEKDLKTYDELLDGHSNTGLRLGMEKGISYTYTSMTIDSSRKAERDGGGFGYIVTGNINLEDQTLQYKINLNENKEVRSLFIN